MMHNLKKNPTPVMGFEPGPPVSKSNALTTEPKTRLLDAVCQRLHFLYDTLYRIAVLLIDATHHVIYQPDLPTTADNLE